MTVMNKQEMRRLVRARNEGREIRDLQSQAICRHILQSDEYKSARMIGAYVPMLREADITAVLLDALHTGKALALPLCGEPPRMTLRRVTSLDDLVSGAYGILEPRMDAEVVPLSEVDLLLVPLEAIDGQGYRLGKGGGYYDCLLTGENAMTIGCALTWQWMDRLPREVWDRPLCACADMHGLHYFNEKRYFQKGNNHGYQEEAEEN